MDAEIFIDRQAKRAARRAARAEEIEARYHDDLAKAVERRDTALNKLFGDEQAEDDADTEAFNTARRLEREAIVVAANAEAGLDADGNIVESKPKKKTVRAT